MVTDVQNISNKIVSVEIWTGAYVVEKSLYGNFPFITLYTPKSIVLSSKGTKKQFNYLDIIDGCNNKQDDYI